jgi:surface carbohydrate biosynthesis protein (TIGR04326 family)
LLIWDLEGAPPAGTSLRVLWRSYVGDGGLVSVPRLVELHAQQLRPRFLAWIHDLGLAPLNGKSLLEHLVLRPGFSYWWMTQIAEKCNFEKSPLMDDAVRFFAFEDWAKGQDLASVRLVTANPALARCMQLWCAQRDLPLELDIQPQPAASKSWVRRAYAALPQQLQALVWLVHYLLARWPLRGVGLAQWRSTAGRVSFFSYLFNLVPAAAAQGRFESRYWGPLPDRLLEAGCQTNWLHIYVKDPLLPTAKCAADLINAFNRSCHGRQCHVALDTFLGPGVVWQALRDWGRLLKLAACQRQPALAQMPHAHLWPMLEQDWQTSLAGVPALTGLLQFNLLERALQCLPKQARATYLQENQGWEFGLIQAWRAAGHGDLFGSPHSSVRFWDLRYFFDPRSYQRAGWQDLPMPTGVACNGPVMRSAFESAGYPSSNLLNVEALRYLHLETLATQPTVTVKESSQAATIRLLVLGDYLLVNTRLQLGMLEQATALLAQRMVVVLKPHPACPVDAADYPGLALQISIQPIAELLADCDVAYSSAVTTAAVDAYSAAVPTVVVLDPNTLNLSPLRGCPRALFASTPQELAQALEAACQEGRGAGAATDFFTLDSQVPRWRRLIQGLNALN